MIASYYISYTNHFDRSGIKEAILKIKKLTVSICPKYFCTQLNCAKNSCGEI